MNKELASKHPLIWIETYGCQMNKYDSELVAGLLLEKGCAMASRPDQADVILVNTCSVRDHAEQRVLGRLDTLAGWRKGSSERKLAVLGCMAQRMGCSLKTRKPFVDWVVGPDDYRLLPDLVFETNGHGCIHTTVRPEEAYDAVRPHRTPGICGWVAIMRGCNNACSYCVVPSTRGQERSRPAESICAEIRDMVQSGFREITLLGQNVNSFHDGRHDFPELLSLCSRVEGLRRLRFMTSHPKDFTLKICDVMAGSTILCPHIHLPFQSGSNRILSLMKRNHSKENYLLIVDRTRAAMPELALTTDVLVGFPGETESDFLETVDLLQTVRFDDAFTYRYSPREGTPAAKMTDELPDSEKLARLEEVIRIQRAITREKKENSIGKTCDVLPETESRKSADAWMGRTPGNAVVVFPKDGLILGEPVSVIIEKLKGTTLVGRRAGSVGSGPDSQSRRSPCGSCDGSSAHS
jgi:tRNA-2-methylthio-N6-dimethylallyladenosine synthase